MDIRTQVEIIEELSAADGSAGWCAMIGSDGGFYSAALDDAAARELYPDLDAVTAGWIVPAGSCTASTAATCFRGGGSSAAAAPMPT